MTRTRDIPSTTDANLDPLTGAPGSHPVGTGVGAILGGVATGAAVGTAAGPVGTAIGAAAGAIVGGLAGKAIAEQIDPTAEETYWRENYSKRPYVDYGAPFDDYSPAYNYGVDAYSRFPGERYEDIEPRLASDWDSVRGESNLTWERAKDATRDAWQRVSDTIERATPGDSDRDGK
ncbi:hypothetical protein HLB44_08500 [Aquincola sp. S2]|uniref:Glycine zipper domain-containing protein n=1 Tax=Pseudaquabacterium terrae TaxID=2732868 RepID=A0ABX2EEH4_9BURK|nr:glycine zipper domain-containing protein [Aquabacterium terrae]NRF67018.1 hypothetical protein [Aquabacterium terrae]